MIGTSIYNPQLGDLVLYIASDLKQPIVGMIINIYEEDIEGYGRERLYTIEWYEQDEEDVLGRYGYSLVQADKYRKNYLKYRSDYNL